MSRRTPDKLIRDEILAIPGYRVPDAAGMVKLDAMENPYALPEDVRRRIGEAVANAPINRYPDAGSTRLKAGTATQLALNMISTTVMVQLGKTWGNLMVDLRATNAKLVAPVDQSWTSTGVTQPWPSVMAGVLAMVGLLFLPSPPRAWWMWIRLANVSACAMPCAGADFRSVRSSAGRCSSSRRSRTS